jgi:hypothetical protein
MIGEEGYGHGNGCDAVFSTTEVASVAAVHMDEAGETTMAMLIVYACVIVRVLHAVVTGRLLYRIQAWRRR